MFKEDLKQGCTFIHNESSTMSVEKTNNGNLVLVDLIDIYNGTQLIENDMKLNNFLNIVEDIAIFKEIARLTEELNSENNTDIFNKIEHLKAEFKEFKTVNGLEEMEEESI